MSNRYYRQFTCSNNPGVVILYASISFGSTGAPTVSTSNGAQSITSVTRNSAGDYTIVFQDLWSSLLGVDHVFNSGSSAPASPGMYVKANNVAVAASKSIELVFNTSGTATDPASGEIVYLEFHLKNSSVKF